MEGKRLIQRLTLRNFLSYGSEGASIDLLPLNVLIGPNASGKSNLLEALSVLRATASDLPAWLRSGGGVEEYIWKGGGSDAVASIEALVDYPGLSNPLRYALGFSQIRHRPRVVEESIDYNRSFVFTDEGMLPQVFYSLRDGQAVIHRRAPGGDEWSDAYEREIPLKDLAADRSILSQRKDPELYPELTYLAERFDEISVIQEWTFGRRARVRAPQPADLPTDFLLPDASNLVLVLHELMQRSQTEERLIEYLRVFYQSAQRVRTRIQGGTVELYIDEGRDDFVPASRLSDGTLRYLSLLTILLHPSPPPLVCFEEPELGLHPDILPTIAELLREASKRTQLVVTTHSEALVSALADAPEAIVVCEPSSDGTQLRRLDRDALVEWLNRYSLGELWRMGEIGGTRW
ncbi:MAG TPA: AAA family ATPase [Longimicrobium sp.]|jgi:predicted ATPase